MKKQNLIILTIAALILAAGIFLRFWQLNAIPPGIQYDEAYNGLDALQALETNQFKIFYPDNFGREGFHLNITAFFIKIFGVHNFSLRLANALWGSLTLIGFLLLLRELKLSWLASLMGTFMISFSFWHLNFSRTAYRAIMVPLLITWLCYFFFKGVHSKSNKHKYIFFALSGLATGLGFHTYIAFRVAPLIIIILIISLFFTKKDLFHRHWKSALVYILTAFIVMLPIAAYFYMHQSDLTGRTNAVSVFNAPNMSFIEAFSKSLFSHLNSFFSVGDANPRHNFNRQSTIPLAWSVLLVLGFIISVKEILHTIKNYIKFRKNKSANIDTRLFFPSILAQSIFWVMLVPGVLSIEGIPHALRIIGAIPGVFIFTALPFEYAFILYERMKNSETFKLKPWRWNILRVSLAGLILIVLTTGVMQALLYFQVWAKDPKTLSAFERRFFDLGMLVKQLPLQKNNYIITNQNIAVSQDHTDSSMKTVQYLAYPNIKSYKFYHALEGRFDIECNDAQIVFQEADKWLVEQFKLRCPDLKEEALTPEKGVYNFWVLHP